MRNSGIQLILLLILIVVVVLGLLWYFAGADDAQENQEGLQDNIESIGDDIEDLDDPNNEDIFDTNDGATEPLEN